MGNNGNRSHWNMDRDRREFDDRDEGNRWGDHPGGGDRSIDHGGMGQSGYSAGRYQGDRSLDYQTRNQGYASGAQERQAFGTDDRFTGRGGTSDYLGDRDWQSERGYDQSYGGATDHRGDNRSFRSRDYGPSESERGAWSTSMQRNDARMERWDMDRGTSQGVTPRSGQGAQMGEHRGKGPRGYTRSDERIKDHVCEVLTDDAHIDASGIDVAVSNGEVTLTGMVPDRQTKRRAEQVIEELSGVRDVTNQLKVGAHHQDRDPETGARHEVTMASNPHGNGAVSSDKKARA